MVENEIRMVVDDDINVEKKKALRNGCVAFEFYSIIFFFPSLVYGIQNIKTNRNAAVTCEWNVIESRVHVRNRTHIL